jgi:hypothetical protein
MKTLNRFQKQRNSLIKNIEMRLKLFREFQSFGVCLYDKEILSLKNRLSILKKSKNSTHENNLY